MELPTKYLCHLLTACFSIVMALFILIVPIVQIKGKGMRVRIQNVYDKMWFQLIDIFRLVSHTKALIVIV